MSTNAVQEKAKRDLTTSERKKVQPINSDLGEIITARQRPTQRIQLSTPPTNDFYNIKPVLSRGNVDSLNSSNNLASNNLGSFSPEAFYRESDQQPS